MKNGEWKISLALLASEWVILNGKTALQALFAG
jgi:hypothetical protein